MFIKWIRPPNMMVLLRSDWKCLKCLPSVAHGCHNFSVRKEVKTLKSEDANNNNNNDDYKGTRNGPRVELSLRRIHFFCVTFRRNFRHRNFSWMDSDRSLYFFMSHRDCWCWSLSISAERETTVKMNEARWRVKMQTRTSTAQTERVLSSDIV